MNNRFLTLGILFALGIAPVASVRSQQSSPAKTPRTVIGSFAVGPFATATFKKRNANVSTAVLTARNGGVVEATSALYDIAAKTLNLSITSVGGKNKPSDMSANGSVKIVIRDADIKARKTVITCNNAKFESSTNTTDRGVLRLIGNVVSDTYDPVRLAAPVHWEGETGRIVFLPDNEFDLELTNGTITGQPIEPSPKPKGQKP